MNFNTQRWTFFLPFGIYKRRNSITEWDIELQFNRTWYNLRVIWLERQKEKGGNTIDSICRKYRHSCCLVTQSFCLFRLNKSINVEIKNFTLMWRWQNETSEASLSNEGFSFLTVVDWSRNKLLTLPAYLATYRWSQSLQIFGSLKTLQL